jgi:phosphatidylglycerol:prolipoprotein diacylglycerol transferase
VHPVLFEIPGLGWPVPSFGVMVALGFLLATWLWGRFLARYGDDPKGDPERGAQVGTWVLIGVIAGARLLYVGVEVTRYLSADLTPAMARYLDVGERGTAALDPAGAAEIEAARELAVGYDFVHHPVEILFVWKGGLVMYGGFAGALLLGLRAAKRSGLRPWNALDTGLVCGFFGLMVGRIGCFLVGDDYGSVVNEEWAHLPFPITLQVPALAWLEAHPKSMFDHDLAEKTLWATQIWMSVNALCVALVGWWVLRHRRWVGQAAAVIFLQYAVTRFAIECFRGDAIRGVWFGGALSTSQLISIPAALFGLWLLWKNRGRRDALVPSAREASARAR